MASRLMLNLYEVASEETENITITTLFSASIDTVYVEDDDDLTEDSITYGGIRDEKNSMQRPSTVYFFAFKSVSKQ
jgi:hypothetical protein